MWNDANVRRRPVSLTFKLSAIVNIISFHLEDIAEEIADNLN